MSNYRPNVAERPAPGLWYDHDIDYAENDETELNVFFYGLNLKVRKSMCVVLSCAVLCDYVCDVVSSCAT